MTCNAIWYRLLRWQILVFGVCLSGFTAIALAAPRSAQGVAQTPAPALALLERAEKAMGTDQLQAVQFIAHGSGYAIGQSFEPGKPWPRMKYPAYALLADFEHGALREEIVRERTDTVGGPAIIGEQRLTQFFRDKSAWNMLGPIPVPAPWAVPERLSALWSTPHGVLKAARRHSEHLKLAGTRALAFSQTGAFECVVQLAANFQVQEVRTTLTHPVLGDTLIVTRYSDYKTFETLPHPSRIVQTWGGYPALDLTIEQVQLNPPFEITIPDRARAAPERVVPELLAPGVWLLAGAAHHSVAIAMQDHVILVDSPISDARAQAIYTTVTQLTPDKKIAYLISTHPHFDTLGGLRGIAAHGANLLAAESSRALLLRVLAGNHQITPDTFIQTASQRPNPTQITGISAKSLLSDGARQVEIYPLQGSQHAKGMLMVYLPAEKLLIQSDAYTPGPPFSAPPTLAQPAHSNLLENIERLQLQVERIVPLRGRVVPIADLYRAVGRAAP